MSARLIGMHNDYTYVFRPCRLLKPPSPFEVVLRFTARRGTEYAPIIVSYLECHMVRPQNLTRAMRLG